jgi:dimethylargininase
MEQYEAYVATLKNIGIEVVELEPLEEFPDAYFVEDAAVVTPEVAVMMRPGTASRRDEPGYIQKILADYRRLEFISTPGTIDGGDVLIVDRHCIVGLSGRTNRSGAEQLCEILGDYGYRVHFKSSVNFLDNKTLLVTRTCNSLRCISDYERIVVPDGEEYAANVVWINGRILVARGFPGTLSQLRKQGYETIEMSVSEIEKMDGGLTCLSLRLN